MVRIWHFISNKILHIYAFIKFLVINFGKECTYVLGTDAHIAQVSIG